MRNYTVIVEWSQAGGEMDADEIVVRAASPTLAETTARARWVATVGQRWPNMKVDRIWSTQTTQHTGPENT